MDFEEMKRLRKGIAGALDDIDYVGRQMRELDVTRSLRELNDAASGYGEAYRAARDLKEMDITRGLREADSVARSLREADSVARSLREADNVSKSLREAGSVASSLREMTAASSLPESVLGLREMNPRVAGLDRHEMERLTGGLYDQAREYLAVQESIQRQVRQSLEGLERGGISSVIREMAGQDVYEEWRRTLTEAAGNLTSAYVLARGADFEQLRSRGEMLSDLLSGSPVFGMLARELASSASAGALSPALDGGFGGELLGYIEGTQAVDSEEGIADFLKAFLGWLLSLAQRLPSTKLSNDVLLNIFLTVASLLYGQYSSNQTEQRLREEIRESRKEARQHHEEDRRDHKEILQVVRENHEEDRKEMREMEARLTEKISRVQGKDDGAKALVVIRAAKLRSGPGKEFETLQVLPPNIQVEELGREGEWMHVKYFDYAEGELRSGWISVELLVEARDGD